MPGSIFYFLKERIEIQAAAGFCRI